MACKRTEPGGKGGSAVVMVIFVTRTAYVGLSKLHEKDRII